MNICAELIMAGDFGFGEKMFQFAQHSPKRIFLQRSAGVGRVSPFVQAAFVADADAVEVEAEGVGADFTHGARLVQRAVFRDVEMIADALEATLEVTLQQLLLGERYIYTGGTAMDNEILDAAGDVYLLLRKFF